MLRTIIDDWVPVIPSSQDLGGYFLVAFILAESFGRKRANGVMGVCNLGKKYGKTAKKMKFSIMSVLFIRVQHQFRQFFEFL